MSSTIEAITYTSDQELQEITARDNTVEVIGYIESVIASKEVIKDSQKMYLFKVILSNESSKITLLIWGLELIAKYQKEMILNRIVHLKKAVSKLANAKYQKDEKMIPFELIVHAGTSVEYLGMHGQAISNESIAPKYVNFLGTVGVTGPVVIEGYLKTTFSLITHRKGTMSWGSGVITDGVYKINVQIAQFISSNIKKGTKIKLTGNIKSIEPPTTIHCTDMNSIEIVPNAEPMSKEQLIHGVRTPRRPLVETSNNEEVKQAFKKFALDGKSSNGTT